MTMDAQTGEVAGASVQIGAPITEKGLIEVVLRARDEGLYNAITDCGAGGLSSAVGEMASTIGGDVELRDVRLKYPGLAPWEIWLSEAQERMVLAVPPESLPRLIEICALFDVDLTDIGVFEASGRLVVRYAGQVVLDLSNDFLHEGIPQRKLKARLPEGERALVNPAAAIPAKARDFGKALLQLLAHPNIASKSAVIRIYDHEVQGGTIIKPLTGAEDDGPSDACVLRPLTTQGNHALVLGAGVNCEYGKQDAYRMAASVIDEAVRNAVAVGADPSQIALLDNFCWGNPLRPEMLGSLLEAARGCFETALIYQAPFISGKDSLNNEYMGIDGQRHAIPPTLLISSLGVMDDFGLAVTMDLKEAHDLLYLVGLFDPRLGASHYRLAVENLPFDGEVPPLARENATVYRALNTAIRSRMVRAVHDLSEGGLGVAAAEMALAGRLGLLLDISGEDPLLSLFGETNGCLLVEVSRAFKDVFEETFEELPCRLIGSVRPDGRMNVQADGQTLLDLAVDDLVAAWNGQ
jgi:phosphoribosylformylglycinamidine synthase subunit PurSL